MLFSPPDPIVVGVFFEKIRIPYFFSVPGPPPDPSLPHSPTPPGLGNFAPPGKLTQTGFLCPPSHRIFKRSLAAQLYQKNIHSLATYDVTRSSNCIRAFLKRSGRGCFFLRSEGIFFCLSIGWNIYVNNPENDLYDFERPPPPVPPNRSEVAGGYLASGKGSC